MTSSTTTSREKLLDRDEKSIGARRSLKHYFQVLWGDIPPRYQLAKTVFLDEGISLENLSDDDLWKHHDILLEKMKNGYKSETYREPNSSKLSLMDVKVELGRRIFHNCVLCENYCEEDREVTTGKCNVTTSKISSMFAHHGEENELVPSHTIFFAGCNFLCVHCQNWDISQDPNNGEEWDPKVLSEELCSKSKKWGCLNLNWVGGDPTPNIPFILEVLNSLPFSCQLPSVWNSNMYYSQEALKLLDGTQDLYLADLKYGQDKCAFSISKRRHYLETVHRNLMAAQEQGASILIRHLVLPSHLECCTSHAFKWIKEVLGPDTRTNVMFQYRPEYHASDIEDIARPLTREECDRAMELVHDIGLTNAEKEVPAIFGNECQTQ